jgi:hypothetical protein
MTPQTSDQPCPPARPLTLTVELHPDPLNDLLAGRLIILVLQQLWAHDTQADIELSEQQSHRRHTHRNHQPVWATSSDQAIIGLEIGEVIELVEILQDLATWLHDAPTAVKTNWNQRTGQTYTMANLCADLLNWTHLLANRRPLA